MASSDSLTLRMQTQGARQFQAEVTEDAAAVKALGIETRTVGNRMQQATRRMNLMSGASRRASRLMGSLSVGGRNAGLAIAGVGALAVKSGIQFNATMETQTTAFAGFLGSTKAAKVYLDDLYKIAAKTPFEFADVVTGARTLMAFGASAKQAKGTISDLGNAIAATGGGADAIQRSTLALGQIQAAGVLHGQDLNQLVTAGVVSIPKLARKMGLSNEQFRKDMGSNKVTSEEFFKALRDGWQHDPMYRGAAAKQAKTFQGQLSTLHDYTVQTLGTITQPLFDALRRNALPRMTALTEDISRIWGRKKLSLADKLDLTGQATRRRLRPLVDEFSNWWERNKVGDKLEHGFAATMKGLTRVAVQAAPGVAKGFVHAWLDAPVWAKLLSGAWLGKKLGLAKGLGGLLRMGKGGGLSRLAPTPVYVTNWGGKPGMPPTTGGKGKWGKALEFGKKTLPLAASRLAGPLALARGEAALTRFINQYGFGLDPKRLTKVQRMSLHTMGRGASAQIPMIIKRDQERRGRAMVDANTRAGAGYHGIPSTIVVHSHLDVDGKTLAKVTHRQALKDRARR